MKNFYRCPSDAGPGCTPVNSETKTTELRFIVGREQVGEKVGNVSAELMQGAVMGGFLRDALILLLHWLELNNW